MTRSMLFLMIAMLAGCNKYGPEQDAKPAAVDAPAVASTTQAADLPESVATAFAPPEVQYTLRCDLNSVAGVGLNSGVAAAIARSAQVVFNGWVVDERLAAAGDFVIVLKGASTYGIAGKTGTERPDVAEAVGSESARASGFGFIADLSQVPAGEYSVHLLLPDSGAACDTTKLLNITES